MPVPRFQRAIVRALALAVTGGIVLGLLPPASGDTESPWRPGRCALSFARLVPDRAVASEPDRAW